MTEASPLDLNMNDRQDFHCLPADAEVELRITKAEVKPTNSGDKVGLNLTLDSPSDPLAWDVRYWIEVPKACHPGDDGYKNYQRTLNNYKELGATFGVDFNRPVDPRELVGQTGYAILGLEENEGRTQNRVKRFCPRRR